MIKEVKVHREWKVYYYIAGGEIEIAIDGNFPAIEDELLSKGNDALSKILTAEQIEAIRKRNDKSKLWSDSAKDAKARQNMTIAFAKYQLESSKEDW